jgi:hypothetical protein
MHQIISIIFIDFPLASYYLPVYYQVLGASATRAGIEFVSPSNPNFVR